MWFARSKTVNHPVLAAAAGNRTRDHPVASPTPNRATFVTTLIQRTRQRTSYLDVTYLQFQIQVCSLTTIGSPRKAEPIAE